jgi:type I restriction enzyme S subunit
MENGFEQTEIGLIPEDWEVKSFKECINKERISRGIKVFQREYKKSGRYPIIDQGANFIAGYTNDKSKLYTGHLPVIVFGDHTRIFKYVDFSFSLGADGTKLILPKDFLNPRYFYYYLCNLSIESKGYNRHYKYLKEKFIAFPQKSEQKIITSVLSKIQQAIEQQNKIIQTTKELKKSLMHKLFTEGLHDEEQKETEIGLIPKSWQVELIGNVVEKTKQTDPRRKTNFTFKYIDVSGISNEYFRITEHKIYNNSNAPSRARKLVEANDVIFATVRPTLKRIAYIDESYDGEICSTAFCILRSKKDILLSKYLYYCVQKDEFIEGLARLQRGASYPAVTDNDIKRQKIPLPSYEEQKEIANVLSNIDKKIQQAEARKQSLQALFKTMLNQLMTGRIRVKDLDVEVKENV